MTPGKYNPLTDNLTDRQYASSQMVIVNEIRIGSVSVLEEDIVKFKKLLNFMDFAMSASPELRNLMVAYEAKQKILK